MSDISCSCHCLFLHTAKLCASYLPTVWFCPGALGTSFSRSPRQCSWQWTPYGSGGISVEELEPEEEWWRSNSCKLKLQRKNLKGNDEVAVVVNWDFRVLKLTISRTRIKAEWCFILICKSTWNSQEPRKVWHWDEVLVKKICHLDHKTSILEVEVQWHFVDRMLEAMDMSTHNSVNQSWTSCSQILCTQPFMVEQVWQLEHSIIIL